MERVLTPNDGHQNLWEHEMILTNPVHIGPRLLPTITIGDTDISIEYSQRPGDDGRTRWEYHIDAPTWECNADDLQSGCQGGTLQEGMDSLLSFLGAAADAFDYQQRTGRESDNADLFPSHVVEWAYQNSEEICLVQWELEENPNAIDE